jgi:Co/Zn/Cd efflux system component
MRNDAGLQKTTITVQKMDCAAEERLIRMKLEGLQNISSLEFDIPNRRVDVYHSGNYQQIFNEIAMLHLDASLVASSAAEDYSPASIHSRERILLLRVLAINCFFFLLELLMGFISGSMGLVADSLDMLADSLVYGLAIFVVGGTTAKKKGIAKISGYFQLLLAAFGIIEVIRRFLGFGEVPRFGIMIGISILALMGNAASLVLLQKSKSKEAHMQASVIFTSNDVIINLGVIIAGVLVFATHTKFPDLIVGAIVFVIVARGAFRILQLAK